MLLLPRKKKLTVVKKDTIMLVDVWHIRNILKFRNGNRMHGSQNVLRESPPSSHALPSILLWLCQC